MGNSASSNNADSTSNHEKRGHSRSGQKLKVRTGGDCDVSTRNQNAPSGDALSEGGRTLAIVSGRLRADVARLSGDSLTDGSVESKREVAVAGATDGSTLIDLRQARLWTSGLSRRTAVLFCVGFDADQTSVSSLDQPLNDHDQATCTLGTLPADIIRMIVCAIPLRKSVSWTNVAKMLTGESIKEGQTTNSDPNFWRIGGERGDLPGQFNAPGFCCVDERRRCVIVPDRENSRIQGVNPCDGKCIFIIENVLKPRAVCVLPLSGRILVSEGTGGRLSLWDAPAISESTEKLLSPTSETVLHPKRLRYIGKTGTWAGESADVLLSPHGMAFLLGFDVCLVADFRLHCVKQVFTSELESDDVRTRPIQMQLAFPIRHPNGICCDDHGSVYCTAFDPPTGVHVFRANAAKHDFRSQTTKSFPNFTPEHIIGDGFQLPQQLYFSDTMLVVCEGQATDGCLRVFDYLDDYDSRFQLQDEEFGHPSHHLSEGKDEPFFREASIEGILAMPTGICLSNTGAIFISDVGLHTVFVLIPA